LATPYLYGRFQLLSLFYKNAPNRLPRIEAFKSHEIKFADRAKNCEDALLVESKGLAILSCDLGRDTWNTVMVGASNGP
jgi:arylesterase / paraoxonase